MRFHRRSSPQEKLDCRCEPPPILSALLLALALFIFHAGLRPHAYRCSLAIPEVATPDQVDALPPMRVRKFLDHEELYPT
jgi:hypothetical protein